MENNDYLKDIIEDEMERQEIYKIGEEREKESERHYEEALLRGRINRIESNTRVIRCIAAGLATALVGTGLITLSLKSKEEKSSQNNINVSTTKEVDDITLTQEYTVVFGDSLSAISNRTGIKQSKIVEDNSISNPNKIYMNQHLELNYSINQEDLKYYTESIPVEGKDFYQIVAEYKTTIKTIRDLNKEAIICNKDGSHTIISDTILVPKFITINELKELKAKGK